MQVFRERIVSQQVEIQPWQFLWQKQQQTNNFLPGSFSENGELILIYSMGRFKTEKNLYFSP